MPASKQFNPAEALDRAMEAFWEKGYEATSMCDLLGRMGIQKGSFYATFSSKRDVYLSALRRYGANRLAEFRAAIDGLHGLAAIDAMFTGILADCSSNDPCKGCMLVNAAQELAPLDEEVGAIVREGVEAHEVWLADLLREGQERGEIKGSLDIEHASRSVLGMMISMRVLSRAGMSAEWIASIKRQALAEITAADSGAPTHG